MGDELGDGVHLGVGLGDPADLVGGEAGDGGVEGDEPLGLVVGGMELLEQDLAQVHGLRLLLLGEGERSEEKEGCDKEGFAHAEL